MKYRIVAGFDWDAGNRKKCQKHGVSVRDIEGLFANTVAIKPDPSVIEQRFRAIGRTEGGLCFWCSPSEKVKMAH